VLKLKQGDIVRLRRKDRTTGPDRSPTGIVVERSRHKSFYHVFFPKLKSTNVFFRNSLRKIGGLDYLFEEGEPRYSEEELVDIVEDVEAFLSKRRETYSLGTPEDIEGDYKDFSTAVSFLREELP